LQLLRMANYLIQTGNTRLLDTLDTLLGALLAAGGSRREPKGSTTSAGRPENVSAS
jgi:hypothetical protein